MMENPTILCVDDDLDDLHLLQKAIHSINSEYTIQEAHDGVDALQKLQNMKETGNLPALIVLDINMPKMDGRETFLSIKNDGLLSQIPIVILSTSSSILDRIFFHKKNIEYITKPIQFDTLLAIATKLLTFIKVDRKNSWAIRRRMIHRIDTQPQRRKFIISLCSFVLMG